VRMDHETLTPSGLLRVSSVNDEPSDDVIGVLIEASFDSQLVDATYLPEEMSAEEAREYASERAGRAWVMFLDDVPVGWYEIGPIHSTCGFETPEGTLEREVWLLSAARGMRLINKTTELLRLDFLKSGVTHLLGVTWDSNVSAKQGLLNSGATRLGLGLWEYPGYTSGWCEVWLIDLRD
jgi:hypothetical protein